MKQSKSYEKYTKTKNLLNNIKNYKCNLLYKFLFCLGLIVVFGFFFFFFFFWVGGRGVCKFSFVLVSSCERLRHWPLFVVLGQPHVNGWSYVIASQNEDSTDYIFPFRLKVLQWSHHLFNCSNK